MASTALVVHLCRCVASVHLTELEQAKALIKVLDDDFAQVAHHKLFSFGVFEDLERLM